VRLQVQTAKIEPDVTIVRLIGRLITLVEGRALEALVQELVSRGEKKLIFDLCGIEEIGSSACRFLMQCYFTTREAGGELRLASANPKVSRLCRISRLDTMLPFYRTVAAASKRFDLVKGA
jgi:anti-sigma B factor antagonist